MRPNDVSYNVIGAAMKVHSALGAGIVESAYDTAVCYELTQAGLQFQHQVRLPLSYQGNQLRPLTESISSSQRA